MTIEDGEFVADSPEAIENAMMQTAKDYFGEDLNDDQQAIIRLFLRPIAQEFSRIQNDIGLVLASAQVENATGNSLDLLTSLIGVPRKQAERSRGEVVFSRENPAGTNYTVPEGTLVQTDSIDPIRFQTTESAIINGSTDSNGDPVGETEVTIPVRALEGGTDYNLGANTLTVMPDAPTGVESASNPEPTTGGIDEETDEELRERAQDELAEGSAATAAALISACRSVEGAGNVTIFINDTNTENGNGHGLPSHSFELVVEAEDIEVQQAVGQAILDTKAAGDYSVSGVNGEGLTITGDLPNGQTHDVGFSTPEKTQIYVDVSLVKTDLYEGDTEVRDSIIDYLGGTDSTGQKVSGTGVDEDVIHTQVQQAVMDVNGVYDINHVYVGTTSGPSQESNISIGEHAIAYGDATDGSITISKSDK